MAHRTNITQVREQIPARNSDEEVTDPVCGMKIARKTARNMLFRPDATYYFCSKDCQQKFLSRGFKVPERKAA